MAPGILHPSKVSFFNFWHGQIRETRLRWKERLQINKIAKFERDLLKINKDIIAPQSHEILKIFGWGGGGKEAVNKLCGAIPYHVSHSNLAY